MIVLAHVVTVEHAVTGERLEPAAVRVHDALPNGVLFERRNGQVIVAVDLDRFRPGERDSVRISLLAGSPFAPAALSDGGWIEVPNLPIIARRTPPQRHRVTVWLAPIRLDVQLVDPRGSAVRGAAPTLQAAGRPTIPLKELASEVPRLAGRYRLDTSAALCLPLPGELHVGPHRAAVTLSYREPVELRSIVVPDDHPAP